MIALLTGLVPLILQLGSLLINWFVKGQQQKQDALTAFYSAIQAHANDALKSVQLRQDYQDELDQLNQQPPANPPKA